MVVVLLPVWKACSSFCRASSTLTSISPMETLPSSREETKKLDYVFVVNLNGANGKTANSWKKLFPKLNARLSDYNVSQKLTTGPAHAVQLTREVRNSDAPGFCEEKEILTVKKLNSTAIRNGAAAVIAVGGDGTLHEVVNGFFEDGKLIQPKFNNTSDSSSQTALGLIPMGTGSDFARVFGWDTDPVKALDRIARGEKRKIDVGLVTYGKEKKERFFINVADLHLSAKAGFYAGQYKRLGSLCYVVGALQAFQDHNNRDLKIRVDGGEWEILSNVTAICVGNSKYFGSGMKIAPSADPSSGDLEVVILREYKWYDFILKLPKLYQGSHVEQANVSSIRVHTLDVDEVEMDESYGGTYLQADGEHAGFLSASFSVLPGVIDFFL